MEKTQSSLRMRVLVAPRLQLRIVMVFLCCACVSTLVQVLLLTHSLSSLAERLPVEGHMVLDELPSLLRGQVLLTFLLTAPLMLAVGILETFRLVGPMKRIDRYLKDVAGGKKPEPCRLRKNDELQELCRALNEAIQPLLHAGASAAGAGDGPSGTQLERVPSLVDAPASTQASGRS
jgi:hypothetical protein